MGGLGVQLSNPDAKNLIADRYIVVYKKTTTDEQVVAHQAGVMQKVKARGLVSRSRDGRVHSTGMNAFSMMGWRAMVLDADNGLMDDIAGADEVDYVEQDSVVRASSLVQQLNAPTGLYRMSHTELGTGSYVFDNSAGTGSVVYVVDTGIRTTHTASASQLSTKRLLITNRILEAALPLQRISSTESTRMRTVTVVTSQERSVAPPLELRRTCLCSLLKCWTQTEQGVTQRSLLV